MNIWYNLYRSICKVSIWTNQDASRHTNLQTDNYLLRQCPCVYCIRLEVTHSLPNCHCTLLYLKLSLYTNWVITFLRKTFIVLQTARLYKISIRLSKTNNSQTTFRVYLVEIEILHCLSGKKVSISVLKTFFCV